MVTTRSGAGAGAGAGAGGGGAGAGGGGGDGGGGRRGNVTGIAIGTGVGRGKRKMTENLVVGEKSEKKGEVSASHSKGKGKNKGKGKRKRKGKRKDKKHQEPESAAADQLTQTQTQQPEDSGSSDSWQAGGDGYVLKERIPKNLKATSLDGASDAEVRETTSKIPVGEDLHKNLATASDDGGGTNNRQYSCTSLNITELIEQMDDGDSSEVHSVGSEPSLVAVEGYRVKPGNAELLKTILAKHGDIGATCSMESVHFRSIFMDFVVEILHKLLMVNISGIKEQGIQDMLTSVKELERQSIEVGWLKKRLEDIIKAKQTLSRLRSLKYRKDELMSKIQVSNENPNAGQAENQALKENVQADKQSVSEDIIEAKQTLSQLSSLNYRKDELISKIQALNKSPDAGQAENQALKGNVQADKQSVSEEEAEANKIDFKIAKYKAKLGHIVKLENLASGLV